MAACATGNPPRLRYAQPPLQGGELGVWKILPFHKAQTLPVPHPLLGGVVPRQRDRGGLPVAQAATGKFGAGVGLLRIEHEQRRMGYALDEPLHMVYINGTALCSR